MINNCCQEVGWNYLDNTTMEEDMEEENLFINKRERERRRIRGSETKFVDVSPMRQVINHKM